MEIFGGISKLTYRVSEKDLRDEIESFSEQTGVCFSPNFCYGSYGVQIMIPNSAGCVSDFIGLGTKRETYEELRTISQYFCETDKRFDKYKISKCMHRDSLNHYEGKKDVSVMHEYTQTKRGKEIKTYHCSACHRKDLIKQDYIKSKIPITWRGLKNKVEKMGGY